MDEAGERMATNIRKGVLEPCVLALLTRRDMYGLELAETLVARGLTASEGSLYPLLARMRDGGTVETRWEAGAGARSRRYYAVTPLGRAQLETFRAVWGELAPRVAEALDDVPARHEKAAEEER